MSDAMEMIRAVFEDGEAEINGRVYAFHKMAHKQRRKVFAYYTAVAPRADAQDLSFLDEPGFEAVEAVINDAVSFDGSLLSRIGERHWEEFPGDYVTFILTALAVISYPFLPVGHTG